MKLVYLLMGVTYEEVATEASKMAEQGIEPSVRLIQQRLGGSNSTIGPHLRTWRDVESDGESELPPALLTLARHMHKTFKLEAETALADDRAELESSRQLWEIKYQAMADDLEDAKRELASQKDMMRGIVGHKDIIDGELAQHKRIREQELIKRDELLNEIEDLKKQIHSLTQTNAVEGERYQSLESQRDDARQARDQLQKSIEQTTTTHREEIAALDNLRLELSQKLASLDSESKLLNYKQAEDQEEIRLLRAERDRLIATHKDQAKTINDLKIENTRLDENANGLQQRLSGLEQEKTTTAKEHQQIIAQHLSHIDSLKQSLKARESGTNKSKNS